MNIKGCERVKFIFSPDASHGSLHISEGGVRIDCVERERRRPICCSVFLLPFPEMLHHRTQATNVTSIP